MAMGRPTVQDGVMSVSPPFTGGRHSRRVGRRGVAGRSVPAVVAVLLAVLSLAPWASAAGVEWNIERIGAPASTTADPVIAVVDTGVDGAHPALAGRVLPQLDFTGDRQRGDPQGHGTHVAGTVAGAALDCGNGPSAIGVAPNARILPIRVLDAEGDGRVSDVVAGIRAAADDPRVTIINLSLGGDLSFLDGGGDDFRDAITYAWSKGKIPVLAAGNAGLLGGVFGSGYGGLDAVVVTATTKADRKAGYASSVGSAKWGIAAPGGDGSGRPGDDVLSAYPDNKCAVLGGTSMAAPHVSGALAVLRSRGLGPQAAIDRLLETATPIGDRSTYGAGLVNLRVAVEVPDATTPATNPTRQPTTTAPASAPTPGATATPTPRAAPDPPVAGDETPTDGSSVPDEVNTEPDLSPRVTLDAEVDADELAARDRPRDGGGESPGALLVATAVAAGAGVAVAGWRLRRLL